MEQFLLLAGCSGLLYLLFVLFSMHHAQAAARAMYRQSTTAAPSAGERLVSDSEAGAYASLAYGPPASRIGTGSILGQLQIPQLGLSAPLIDGVSAGDLRRGAGHIPGTAMPGGLGTVGIAAHRDTYFRPLRKIAPGMEIQVTGSGGMFRYQVESAEIVDPGQVSVLDLAATPQLTLITCYPFNYVGSAPRRFVVRARLLSLEAQ